MWAGFIALSALFLGFIVFLTLVYTRDPLEAHLFFFLLLLFSAVGVVLFAFGIYIVKTFKKTQKKNVLKSRPIGAALIILGLLMLYPPFSRDLSKSFVSIWFPSFQKVETGVSTVRKRNYKGIKQKDSQKPAQNPEKPNRSQYGY
jgi:hypothetical protein